MTMRLALTQAPHPSYWNGGLAQTSRQYWLRPTQKPFAPVNIDTIIAGMAPNERRVIATVPAGTLAAYDAETGSGYGITDWTPFNVFDETTQQLIHGGKRRTNKVVLWSAATGEWRQERMERIPTDFYVGGHWYGMTAKNGDNHLLHDRTYNPETQSWSARIPGLPGGATTYIYLPNYGTAGGWLWGSETMTVHDVALGTNATLGNIGHTGGHELKVYHPLHDKVLAVGGSSFPTKTTLIDGTTGAFESRAACPANIHMAGVNDENSTAIAHPSGCWLFMSSFPAPRRVWAYWPNADVWQEVAELPLLAAYTYPTTAWDADRQIAYELSGSNLYAWKLPEVTDPSATIHPSSGRAQITGYAPAVLQSQALTPSAGRATLTGHAPTLAHPQAIAPASGAIQARGYAPTVLLGNAQLVEPVAGRLSVSGNAPSLSQPITLSPAAGHAQARGYAPTVTQYATVAPSAGRVLATGHAPAIAQPRAITPQPGRAQLAGHAPIVVQGIEIVVAPLAGQVQARGYAPAVEQGGAVMLTPSAGRVSARGYAPLVSTVAVIMPPAYRTHQVRVPLRAFDVPVSKRTYRVGP